METTRFNVLGRHRTRDNVVQCHEKSGSSRFAIFGAIEELAQHSLKIHSILYFIECVVTFRVGVRCVGSSLKAWRQLVSVGGSRTTLGIGSEDIAEIRFNGWTQKRSCQQAEMFRAPSA